MKDPDCIRVLVAGGAGFLGSHLCEHLLARGHDVLCADNLWTGSKRNIAHLLPHPRFEFLRHDVQLPLQVEVDEIYNLACPASPLHYQSDPVQTTKTCVLGAINLLGLARRLRARILQVSTSEIYGDPQAHPQTEEYAGHVNPVGLRSCYNEGKRCAETLFTDYRRQHGLHTKIVRVFNTYGPRMQPGDGRVVSNFIMQALDNRPLTVYGDGRQTRSFCYVDDLIDGIERMMRTPPEVAGPVNLGNPVEYSMLELAETIMDLTRSSSAVSFLPAPSDDPARRRPDIGRARDWLGWEPKVGMHEGLGRTIDYFRRLRAQGGG